MHDDKQLRELLKEWQLPGAPPSLDARVLALRKPWWKSTIRIPVPLAFAIAAVIVIMAFALLRRPAVPPPPSTSVNLADFRPVADMKYRVIRGNE